MERIFFDDIFGLEEHFMEMPVSDQIMYCITLQSSNNAEFRQFGINEAAKFTEDQIVDSLLPIIKMEESHNQLVRDLTGVLLDRISSEKLADKFLDLIERVHSPYYFVRTEALLLLNKIKPELLVDQFDYLKDLKEKDSNFDIQRITKDLLLKISKAWTIAQKIEHYDYAVELESSTNQKESSIGSLLCLQVMETWETEKLKSLLPFFINKTNIETNDFEVSEIASALALRVLLESGIAIRLRNIDYMASFNYYGNKFIRRQFRHLALETMMVMDEKYLQNYALFFIQCLEGKNRDDRKKARNFLKKIDPNKLSVEDLLYFRSSNLWRVRQACKKLARKISEDILFDNLENLINLQKTVTPSVRYLASQLAASISVERLRLKKELLKDCTQSKDPLVVDLAECLLCMI